MLAFFTGLIVGRAGIGRVVAMLALLLFGAGTVATALVTQNPIGSTNQAGAPPASASAEISTAPGARGLTLVEPATALATIKALATADVDYRAGYDRGAFGQAWSDDQDELYGHDGCDTRNNILRRDLVDVEVRPNTNDCVVVAGRLDPEPYTVTARTFTKVRADELQVDHVFALAAAWDAGAGNWSDENRVRFANDPLNLLLVDGALNQAKGASTPSEWMPPNPAVGCSYAYRYALVATKYALPVSVADRIAMTNACQP
jgi:hypothetical protein